MNGRNRLTGFALAALSLAAARIHFHAADAHSQESAVFTVFFFAAACLQGAWGLMAMGGLSLRAAVYGVLLHGGLAAVWAASRTIGVPVGPEPWAPEAVGATDLTATLLEIGIVAGIVWLRRSAPRRRLSLPPPRVAVLPRRSESGAPTA